jgi:hypothetical protein
MAQAASTAASSIPKAELQLSLEAAHRQLLADPTFQHAHSDAFLKEPKVPAWLEWFGEFVRAFSPVISVLFWIGVALIVGLLVYFIATEILGVELFRSKTGAKATSQTSDWRPDTKEARDLLAAADALASEGRFGEAVHLILLRSIEHIDRFRPFTVRPALTARDIGAMAALPDPARPTFVRIANAVERTLFAGLAIDGAEFGACREAYATFALPDGWRE